ncbi:agmatine deiminase [Luminiphilus syltensis NOR5-1B]|uniref:Agmatine deiminase n=1 Tax=Luminiphilus syltensis NOR5-1B TaxID=565045 RepID=B8KSW8_9GAMM|nr:agmatine deiminase family protein [Luminiphilus syltensis]EED36445.1 agmatine deiminase [Luminiphilus syltensis NOR5-1B]
MPPEWAPHTATWMSFPQESYPGTGVSTAEAQAAWSAVANTIAEHEPLHLLVSPEDAAIAAKLVSGAIHRHDCPLDDAWLRDSGPTFVEVDGELRGIDWNFNGWGDHTAFDWQRDNELAGRICAIAGIERESSPLTNEGGGIHVDGTGRVLLTETVQRDEGRNPGWSREDVEEEVHQRLGTDHALWLPRGLYRDYFDHGTRGHVDIVACFTPAGQVLLHWQTDTAHPDAKICREVRDALEQADLTVVELPAPKTLRDNINWVDYSYINHYVCNGAVICPSFDDPNDGAVQEILSEIYPGREIRPVDARVIFAMGGGIHCITQQQPAPSASC